MHVLHCCPIWIDLFSTLAFWSMHWNVQQCLETIPILQRSLVYYIILNIQFYNHMINSGLVSQIISCAWDAHKSSWKASKWGNIFICKVPHASCFSLFSNNFTLHYSQSPSFFVMFIKNALPLAANNSLKCCNVSWCLICYATLSVSNS